MTVKYLILTPLAAAVFVAMFRAALMFKPLPPPKACSETPGHERIRLNKEITGRFIEALNIPTISYERGRYEPAQLLKLIDHIELSFPEIHRSQFVTREKISNYSLVYTINGTNKNLKPYLLTAHLDVVPALKENWSSDPFRAVIKEDNYI